MPVAGSAASLIGVDGKPLERRGFDFNLYGFSSGRTNFHRCGKMVVGQKGGSLPKIWAYAGAMGCAGAVPIDGCGMLTLDQTSAFSGLLPWHSSF
ncbi:hypothetical protein [Aminobacter sp. MET-1]|uniref:hypothetical protein n=1 Tax=Aminobacter sp. MET-1 TaxID=2951085 RepID=UPI00226A2A61|nr:hypothetical protein [Aminobacter sp. MET-1]MCX8569986.1 hypothetical protein [Aminobacter sp. MET-1]